MFGKKKVKFMQVGMFTWIKCPCGQTGLNQTDPAPGEVPAGYAEDDVAKCSYCGRLFLFPVESTRDDGLVIGQGRPTVRP